MIPGWRLTTESNRFDLLCDLIAKWEQQTMLPPKLRSLGLLKHLLDERGLVGADLSRILGRSPALGPMILRGERKITAGHAIRLGEHFGLRADAFLQ